MVKISIIIPTFNASKTLAVALDSIIKQNFQYFEVLLMDGFSTDNTLEIAQSYQDERIRIFSEKDHGIYDAMNKGIKIAKGEWVYFLGSDDRLFSNNTLEKIFQNNELLGYDVIYGNVTSPRFDGIYAGEFDYRKLYYQNICHQAIFFNKDLFKKVGVFNLKYHSYADYEHNIRWFLNKKIKKLYIEDIIADFADGGYSSKNDDSKFGSDKNYRFVCHGINKLPDSFLIEICQMGSVDKKKWIMLKIISVIIRIKLLLRFKSKEVSHSE